MMGRRANHDLPELQGYVDPEADFRKQFARFFGFGKKKKDDENNSKPDKK